MKGVFFIIFLFCFQLVFSQNDSKAVIYFKQKKAIIYLDERKIESKKELRKISVGVHKIKAWAPKYDLFIDSFIVKSKENKFYSKKLTYSENYLFYKHKKQMRFMSYFIPTALTFISGGVFYAMNKSYDENIKKTYNEAIELKNVYDNSFSPDEFDINYQNYYDKITSYNNLQDQQIKTRKRGVVTTSALAATAITLFIYQKTRKKLEYTETPLLSRIIPSINPLNKQVCLFINLY